MTTVTRRVKEVKRPRGGYVNPRTMEVTSFDDGQPSPLDHRTENIHSSLVGMAVDYLSRLANGSEPRDVFRVPLLGAIMAGIKQNGILGWLLRGSWLTSSEYLV